MTIGYLYVWQNLNGTIGNKLVSSSEEEIDVFVKADKMLRYQGKACNFWKWCVDNNIKQKTINVHISDLNGLFESTHRDVKLGYLHE